MEIFHLAGALMEHLLDETYLMEVLHYGFGKLTQKIRFVFITLLIWVNIPNILMEKYFQGNVPLRNLLNEDTRFMS